MKEYLSHKLYRQSAKMKLSLYEDAGFYELYKRAADAVLCYAVFSVCFADTVKHVPWECTAVKIYGGDYSFRRKLDAGGLCDGCLFCI